MNLFKGNFFRVYPLLLFLVLFLFYSCFLALKAVDYQCVMNVKATFSGRKATFSGYKATFSGRKATFSGYKAKATYFFI